MDTTTKKRRFWKGLLIYVCVALALIAVGLFFFWKWTVAYELSRTDGVMDAYLAQQAPADLRAEAEEWAWAKSNASPFESAEEIIAVIAELTETQELTFRKTVGKYTQETPVYTLRLDKREVGTVRLERGEPRLLSFGFDTWQLRDVTYDFTALGQTYTLTAPEQAVLEVNGVPLGDSLRTGIGLYAELEPYADSLPEMDGAATYDLGLLFREPQVHLADSSRYLVESSEGHISVIEQCPAALEQQLTDYARQFLTAYLTFTANASDGPDGVKAYLIPNSILSQRIDAAMDGLSWVHGVTATTGDISLENFRYFGDAALCDAYYTLHTATGDTENQMHILLADTANGWRVAEIAMF